MENAILITVAELTRIIQTLVRAEIEPILQALGDQKIPAKEAADLFGISTRTLDRWRKEYPQLKYYLIGKSIRYSLKEVNDFKKLINKK